MNLLKLMQVALSPRRVKRAGVGRLVPEPIDLAGPHAPGLGWAVARVLMASSKGHAFLDRAYIPALFKLTPPGQRRGLALWLLSLNPHYWVYQFHNIYPKWFTRRQVLEAEYERNAVSRREIVTKVVKPFTRPGMTVLDFGCGPGFLAKETAAHVGKVIATDISRGVIACAKAINGAPNIDYVVNRTAGLAAVADGSLDLVYTFAVLQHLTRDQVGAFLREFHRALKPGGQGLCHMILKEDGEYRLPDFGRPGWMKQRLMVRMTYFSRAEIAALLKQIGFSEVRVVQVSEVGSVKDDIGNEQLVVFRK